MPETERADVVLLFPPLTEARLFPYGSLPMLTAYLREHGLRVAQHDLNIELYHRLFTPPILSEYEAALTAGGPLHLKTAYRREMARFLLEELAGLAQSAFASKTHPRFGIDAVLRFVQQGVELLVEDSLLAAKPCSLGQISAAVAASEPAASDLATRELHRLVDEISARERPRIVGISIAFYSQILPALLIARWVKRLRPDVVVVFGGQQVMLRFEQMADDAIFRRYVDCLGVSAGEEALLGLHRSLRGELAREHVPELVWLDPTASGAPARGPRARLRLDDLPTPDFSGLQIRGYLNDEVQLSIITCVGCYWGRCTFCSYGNRSRRENSYEEATPEKIAADCRRIVEACGVRRINFVDENCNLKLLLAAVQALEEQGCTIRWSTRNRMEKCLTDKAFCQELARRGCVLMSSGYETISQRLLDRMNKGVSASWYQTIVDNLHEVGIPLRLSVMGGLPDETAEETRESIEFLRRNADKIAIDVMQMLVLEPKTWLADDPARHGLQIIDDGELRGNALLSYGMGRMGYKFLYADGDSFERRQKEFLDLFYQVRPKKNDDVPPAARRPPARSSATSPHPIDASELRLFPWVRVIESGEREGERGSLLVDLLWQKFYPLPRAVAYDGASATLKLERSASADPLLYRLRDAGLGRMVHASGSPMGPRP